MIVLDQRRIGAPHFPRGQEWWTAFVPDWVTATVHGDGTVALSGQGSAPWSLSRWVGGFPNLAAAVVADHA